MKKLGFGLMRLPLNDNSKDDSDIDYEQVCKMVDHFLEKGFTYFDTAYPYHRGFSEVFLKKTLVDRHPRDSFVVANKMPTFSVTKSEDYQRLFDEQTEKCGVDYFDYYMLHALNLARYESSIKLGGFEFMKQLKASGKVKHIGLSFHDTADVLDTILTNQPEMEFVQLQINYLDWESENVQARKCYEVAKKHNKIIIIMEPIKGGALANVPEEAKTLLKDYHPDMSVSSWAMRHCASFDDVVMVLSGMSNMEQMEDNTSYMQDFVPLNQTEQDIILKVTDIINGTAIIPCTLCKYCDDSCPKNIPIHSYFSMYNKAKQFNQVPAQKTHYKNLSNSENIGTASSCIRCKKCERHCPQNIRIHKSLKDVALLLENN